VLAQKDNKTKFKLIFANVEERDILLREEFETMKKKYPENFDCVYTLDKPGKDWKGTITRIWLPSYLESPRKVTLDLWIATFWRSTSHPPLWQRK
jgi:NAD(P)H-flavin reductase